MLEENDEVYQPVNWMVEGNDAVYKRYLDKIDAGVPINWLAFWARIPHPEKKKSDFTLEKSDGNTYLVKFVSDKVRSEYEPKMGSSARVVSSLYGDSHQAKVSYASLPCYLLGSDDFSLIVCSANEVIQCKQRFDDILVIENKELFFNRPFVIELIESYSINSGSLLVVLGNGREVANSYFKPIFDKAEHVYCVLDYDLGGLTIYDSLVGLYGDKVKFSTYTDLKSIYGSFTYKCSPKLFTKAIMLCRKHGLVELEEAFRATSRFMEQEVLVDILVPSHQEDTKVIPTEMMECVPQYV